MGAFAMPNFFTEAKKAQDVAFLASKPVILQAWKEYAELTGRQYQPVEHYRTENASVLLLTMGSFSETAMVAVDELREKGEKVGLIRLRLWRPFPFPELQEAIQDAQVLVVLDRCLSYGGPPGPVCSEVKAAMYSQDRKPRIVGFVGGLGGRDIAVHEFVYMIHKGIELADKGREDETEIIGVRG
ncbi:transketolase C-terminal domain-containing protein, partial [Chloroflexota bacterium]